MTPEQARALAIAKLIVERAGAKSRNPYSHSCYVPWRSLDALADALRATGVKLSAPSLGEQAAERVSEAIGRGHDRSARFREEHGR